MFCSFQIRILENESLTGLDMATVNCPGCGRETSVELSNCPHCGQPVNQVEPPPKNWLLESILVTIFCCWPFGIPAIVYASRVENRWYAGRRGEAFEAAKNAKTWTLVSLFVGLGVGLIYGMLMAFGVVASIFSNAM